MALFKNFKSVVYCVAQWAAHVSKQDVQTELAWLQKYVGVDKVYLETYRGEFASKEQIRMIKSVLEEAHVEVSGGITTVTPDLSDGDKKRQRLFDTFCYANEPMRARLKEVSEYTASLFDEFIIDDFFFTQCMCEDCIKEKGNRSWSEYRLQKMMEVSQNLIIAPAKKVNPNVKIIIKYPNWRESFQETGYNPELQRAIFDGIYTGTETRHGAQQDQHLPRYLSYSLPRYMENVAPNRNGGGWFDPFECDRIDTYLEQAYLTAFAKSKEIMHFCWSAVYNNKRATPLFSQYQKIDTILSACGNPVGLSVYIPFNAQGEDHIEDYLGMIGIPMNPTPDFPRYELVSKDGGANGTSGSTNGGTSAVLVTASSLHDEAVFEKIRAFMANGGKVIATSGFVIGALAKNGDKNSCNIEDFTSIRYNGKQLCADEFQVEAQTSFGKNYVSSKAPICFPLLEHRNNATWSKVNAGHGEYHESIVMFDTYAKGTFEVLVLPELPSRIKDMPKEVLAVIRRELCGDGSIWIDSPYGVSLFTYDNNAFGVYCYTNDGCAPTEFDIHIKGEVKALRPIRDTPKPRDEHFANRTSADLTPLYCTKGKSGAPDVETVFRLRIIPGDFAFFTIV